jgi:putative protease
VTTAIELLSPAKNAAFGKVAIQHGADAVYIGAPRFGARAEAANSVADISDLVRFAHLYKAKVYATLNTILYDNEIDDAVRIAWQLYESGVDALIIQDMGLLRCELPPLPLFASTQTHNVTVEKISFLEQVGFKRVILSRELCLRDIQKIRQNTKIELESFVHGALCVSFSGQCYMSHFLTGRSGNRGTCAQPCRSSYQLLDANKQTLIDKAYLLSLKDLNLSAYLLQLMQSGVSSFKIEGRLKDLNYLKNITAFYRQRLDSIMEQGDFCASSSGRTTFCFTPNPHKTFHRGYTDYFIEGRKDKVASPETQKSTGERLGWVSAVFPQYFVVETTHAVSSGDGLCWLHPQRGLEGALVNGADGKKIFPAKPVQLTVGMEIFRNNDFRFEKQLAGESADRRVRVAFELSEEENGYHLGVTDEDGNTVTSVFEAEKITAKDIEKAQQQIIQQLGKLGNTVFVARQVRFSDSFGYFIPAAGLNAMRRELTEQLEALRLDKYRAKEEVRQESDAACCPDKKMDYRGNVANAKAKEFYLSHGSTVTEEAFELQAKPYKTDRLTVLMTTKHCIRYQYNACPVKQKKRNEWKEPLYLRDSRHTYKLEFDCKNCVMKCIADD